MPIPFHLTIPCPPDPQPGAWQLGSASGVSLASSNDGTATVAVLGHLDKVETSQRLAEAYVRAGRNPAAIASAGLAYVVVDRTGGTATCVMPPIGLCQVYWRASGKAISLSSAPAGLASEKAIPPSICADALFRYVYFHMIPGPISIFRDVAKLEAGHWLRWNGEAAELQRYWHPEFQDRPTQDVREAAVELRRILARAVADSLNLAPRAGAFLSGGLDSSTVSGMAARERPGIQTVSMGFNAQGYDEIEFARIASRHFGTTPLEYYVTPDDVLATLPRIAGSFAEPFGNSSAAAAFHCARIAREHGLSLLLAGDGGDELFGGNDRYAKQLIFERYGKLPGFARRLLLEPAVSMAASHTRIFPIGKTESYIQQARVPLPDRLQTYNFLHRHSPAEVFSPAFLEQVDCEATLRQLRQEYSIPATSDPVNRMLFLDWKFTLHDNDLVKVNTMCQLAGVEVAYPMLDQAVVEFSLTIPASWKVHRGQLRWFYKRAMRGFLPDQIIDKTKHGFGLPFGVWTRSHDGLARLAAESLDSLAQRRFFRPEFLRDALRLHREGHASYYGELVWILMVLELWLQQNHPMARL